MGDSAENGDAARHLVKNYFDPETRAEGLHFDNAETFQISVMAVRFF